MKENNEQARQQYVRMTETPIASLVLKLSIPTTISMLVTNLYSMADTYFVGTLGTSASGATGVVFGVMGVIQAFGFMFGHGSGTNLSKQLGARQIETARRFSAVGYYLALIMGVITAVLGLLFLEPFMLLMGSTESILPFAKGYGKFILLAAPAMTTSCVMNNQLRYEGKATFAMIGLTSGGILNIFFDYFTIRILGMGIEGAGIATCISQYIAMSILLVPFLRGKVQANFHPKYFTPTAEILKPIFANGIPSLARQGLVSVTTMVLNRCAGVYGDAAIAAMSIVSRVGNFMFCMSLGLGQGFQPVAAFNFGAKKYNRVRQSAIFMTILGTIIMVLVSIVGFTFAVPIISRFRDDAEVIAIGVKVLRVQCCTMFVLPTSLCGMMLFQSVGESKMATFLSCCRSGVIFVPVLLLLSSLFGLDGIEVTQPVADIICALITAPIVLKFLKALPADE